MFEKILTRQQLNKLAKKYKIETLYLFGSRAYGKAGKNSDYDFAVLLSEQVDPREYGKLKINIISELLAMLNTNYLDLIILNDKNIPLLLKYNIIREGKLLLDKNKSRRVNMEAHILTRWFDWEYFEKMRNDIILAKAAKGKF